MCVPRAYWNLRWNFLGVCGRATRLHTYRWVGYLTVLSIVIYHLQASNLRSPFRIWYELRVVFRTKIFEFQPLWHSTSRLDGDEGHFANEKLTVLFTVFIEHIELIMHAHDSREAGESLKFYNSKMERNSLYNSFARCSFCWRRTSQWPCIHSSVRPN